MLWSDKCMNIFVFFGFWNELLTNTCLLKPWWRTAVARWIERNCFVLFFSIRNLYFLSNAFSWWSLFKPSDFICIFSLDNRKFSSSWSYNHARMNIFWLQAIIVNRFPLYFHLEVRKSNWPFSLVQKVKVIISAETDPGILYQPRYSSNPNVMRHCLYVAFKWNTGQNWPLPPFIFSPISSSIHITA